MLHSRIMGWENAPAAMTTRQGYHGDAFCHAQVYCEGAITSRRIMTGRQGASPRNCPEGRYNEREGSPGHLDHKEDEAWNREITRSALARNS